MSTIRDTMSEILGLRIQGESWTPYIAILDREGRFTRKNMLAMLVSLGEALENQELQIKALSEKLQETEKNATSPTKVRPKNTV